MTRDELRVIITRAVTDRPATHEAINRVLTACDNYAETIATQAAGHALTLRNTEIGQLATAQAATPRNNGPQRKPATPRRAK